MEHEVNEGDLKAAGAELLPEGRSGLRIHGWEIESRKFPILNSFNREKYSLSITLLLSIYMYKIS